MHLKWSSEVLAHPGGRPEDYLRSGAFWRSVGIGAASGVVAEGALGNPWRLAGGFYHEMAHVGQEFGTPRLLRWIPRGLQRVSVWATGGMDASAWRQFVGMATPLYAMNPVEVHAAISGLAYISQNGSLWLLSKIWYEGIGRIVRCGG